MKTNKAVMAAAVLAVSMSAQAAHHEAKDNKAVAAGWIKASCTDLGEFTSYLSKHMADDGMWMPARYVGLGFRQMQEDNEDFGKVMMVMDGTPASKVLKEGDVFVSVAGVESTFENRDRMDFRGAPGEPVKAVIMRDGKEMDIEVTRGVIEVVDDKDTVMRNLAQANAETWGSDSCDIAEQVQEGNVVYTVTDWMDTEEETGIKFKSRTVTRMEFNDMGQVVKAWNMGEDSFVLEQLGYSITR